MSKWDKDEWMNGLVRSLPMNHLILLLMFHWPASIVFTSTPRLKKLEIKNILAWTHCPPQRTEGALTKDTAEWTSQQSLLYKLIMVSYNWTPWEHNLPCGSCPFSDQWLRSAVWCLKSDLFTTSPVLPDFHGIFCLFYFCLFLLVYFLQVELISGFMLSTVWISWHQWGLCYILKWVTLNIKSISALQTTAFLGARQRQT